MAAPPGFNPNASVLPDPGAASAPIHVMRGGGLKGGNRDSILSAYKLGPGQELADTLTEEEKGAFVTALSSGGCEWSTKSILNAKCAPVVKVLKALLRENIRKINSLDIPRNIRIEKGVGFPTLSRLARPTRPIGYASEFSSSGSPSAKSSVSSTLPEESVPGSEAPAVVIRNEDEASENSGSRVERADMNNNAAYNFPPIATNLEDTQRNVLNQNVFRHTLVNSPKMNYRGNKSRRSANVRLNLTRKNKRIFSNFNINSKPVRIYGNSPQNIATRYNYELTKSRKNAQKRAENAERTKRNTQLQKQKLAWEKQAQKETVKTVKSRLNQQIAALRSEKKALPAPKKFYQFWKGGKKTRRGNRK